MPPPGAQQRAHPVTCSYPPVIPRGGDKCHAARHGTRAAYLTGCRCDTSRHAYVRYQKQWLYDRTHGRPRRLPATGARRRLQALACMGWSAADIGAQLGRRGRLNINRSDTISIDLHQRIAALFDQMATKRGPSPTTATLAAARGWLPPLAWDDDTIDDPAFLHTHQEQSVVDQVAIDRYLDGDHTLTLTRAEKTSALHQLIARGDTPATAGARLGINGTYARRYAAEAHSDVSARRDHARTPTNHLEETG